MTRSTGYIAIDRGIFDHWIAKNEKRFKAWQWMIADAAYCPKGCRGSWGVVHVERGQLVGSLRFFAEKWGWPRSNVECFLKRLEREKMVCCKKTRTPTRTPTGTYLAHDITIITICNYDEFNKSSTRRKTQPGLRPGLRPVTPPTQTSMFADESETSTIQPLNLESLVNESMNRQIEAKTSPQRNDPPTKHGRQSSKHKTVFLLKGTEEWRIHATDYREVMGAEPLPNRHGGFWFYALGEAQRPGYQRGWRDKHTGNPSQVYNQGRDFPPNLPQSESNALAPKRDIA